MNSAPDTTGPTSTATTALFVVAPMSASADAGAQMGECIEGRACKGVVRAAKAERHGS